MRYLKTLAVIMALPMATPAFAQNCVDEKMKEQEGMLGQPQAIAVSGQLNVGGCQKPDFPEVNKCGERLTETTTVILTAPDGYSLNRSTVLATKTHHASNRWAISDIRYLTGEDAATRSAAINLSCTKEDKLGGGGCEISVALTGTAEPFIGRDTLSSIIEECRAQG